MLRVAVCPGGAALSVRVLPRARRNEIAGVRAGALLVRLTAPPVEGAANEALLDTLAGALKVPRSRLTISSGERSRDKRICVKGLDGGELRARLSHLVAEIP